jgi:competence protein ComGF
MLNFLNTFFPQIMTFLLKHPKSGWWTQQNQTINYFPVFFNQMRDDEFGIKQQPT